MDSNEEWSCTYAVSYQVVPRGSSSVVLSAGSDKTTYELYVWHGFTSKLTRPQIWNKRLADRPPAPFAAI